MARRIVLIHGAWAAGWVWDRLIERLAPLGFECIAVDLPGSDGLNPEAITQANYVEHVLRTVDGFSDSFWLVAHSGAGVIAANVGEAIPERVLGIVFIAGMMLPSGMSFSNLFETAPYAIGSDAIIPNLVWNDAGTASRVPEEVAASVFFQDASPEDAHAAAARLGWQPRGGLDMRPMTTSDRYERIPRLYVEALQDRSVVLAAQRYMQELSPGAEIVSLNAGHAPQLSQPDQLLAHLLPFIKRKGLPKALSP